MDQNNSFKEQFYLVLAGIFIASLVTCNLIANKFVTVDFGFKVFIVSAGILPYPLTFLVTDLISELYGQKKANLVVFSGFIASLFVLLFNCDYFKLHFYVILILSYDYVYFSELFIYFKDHNL